MRGMGREHGEMRGNGKSEDQGRVDGRKGERGDIKIDTYVNRQTQTDRDRSRERKKLTLPPNRQTSHDPKVNTRANNQKQEEPASVRNQSPTQVINESSSSTPRPKIALPLRGPPNAAGFRVEKSRFSTAAKVFPRTCGALDLRT